MLKEPGKPLAREAIFQHFPGYLASGPGLWRTTPVGVVQSGDWKLMEFYEDQRLELYNLAEDIGETRNLAAEQPGKARELQARPAAWRGAIQAKMPTPNTDRKEVGSGDGGKKGAGKKRGKGGKSAE